MALKTYSGSCHCGAVRFEAELDLDAGTNRCNCSICTKARAWFTPVAPDRLRFLVGADAHAEYRWVPPGKPHPYLTFRFCRTCGIRTVGRGGATPEKDDFLFVNVAALDVAPSELERAPIRYIDGRNDRFDRSPDSTRLL